jgi:hypothetical protein
MFGFRLVDSVRGRINSWQILLCSGHSRLHVGAVSGPLGIVAQSNARPRTQTGQASVALDDLPDLNVCPTTAAGSRDFARVELASDCVAARVTGGLHLSNYRQYVRREPRYLRLAGLAHALNCADRIRSTQLSPARLGGRQGRSTDDPMSSIEPREPINAGEIAPRSGSANWQKASSYPWSAATSKLHDELQEIYDDHNKAWLALRSATLAMTQQRGDKNVP